MRFSGVRENTRQPFDQRVNVWLFKDQRRYEAEHILRPRRPTAVTYPRLLDVCLDFSVQFHTDHQALRDFFDVRTIKFPPTAPSGSA
ncbi:MAG: hypothetical protein U0528_09240 [Anaerolineae bacterium]